MVLQKNIRPKKRETHDIKTYKDLAWLTGFGICYYISIRIGLLFVIQPEGISVIWPASGVALSALILMKRHKWILFIIFTINTIGNFTSGNTLLVSLSFGITNAMEAALAVYLLYFFVGKKIDFSQVKSVLSLFGATVFANGVTACFGAFVSSLFLKAPFFHTWLSWLLSDGFGIILMTPLIVCWMTYPNKKRTISSFRVIESTLLNLTLLSISWFVLSRPAINGDQAYYSNIILPFLIWAAFRFRQRGTASLLFLYTLFLLSYMIYDNKLLSFYSPSVKIQIFSIQIYFLIITLSGLILAAVVSERQKAEKNMRKREARYRMILQSAMDGFWLADTKGNFLEINDAYAQMSGYKIKELLTMNVSDIEAIENHEQIIKRIQRAIHVGFDRFETVHRRKDNSTFDVEISLRYLSIDKGRFVAFIKDITAQKKDEHNLQLTKNLLNESQELGKIGAWEFDPVSKKTIWTDNQYKLYGYESEEIEDEHLSFINHIVHPDDKKTILEKFKTLFTNKKNFSCDFRIKRKDGQERIMRGIVVPELNKAGEINRIYGSNIDITEHKRTEEAIKKSEELFKLITDHTSALVSIHDAEANYIFASPSHEQLGFKPKDLIGKPYFTMMEEKDIKLLVKYLEKTQKGKLVKASLNYRLKDKKGGFHYFRGAFDAVFKSDGSLERIICVGEDITQLRRAQEEKVTALTLAGESKKLALVGQIAGKMAHDFNNVLGAIMGNTELALLDCPDDNTNQTLELILEQTIRGKNLTKNLVAFAKDQEPKQKFFSIDEKIELVLSLLKKDIEGIKVTREYDQKVPELLADPGMMEHALVNLLQNSIHATSLIEKPQIIVRTYKLDELIFIQVEDNGCGIPNEFIENIYDPSFTLKGSRDKTGSYRSNIKGTGYGMANVKKYIEQHKGTIKILSDLNKGTTITISLPITQKQLTNNEVIEIKSEENSFEKYILLVEDEQAISDVQYKILTHEPCNHKVDIASSGQAAIDLFSRNNYDFISLDYILPGQLNGMDFYRHVREKNKLIPILFISGNLEFLESIKDLKQRDPFIDHLSKPCRNIDYINGINKLIFKN